MEMVDSQAFFWRVRVLKGDRERNFAPCPLLKNLPLPRLRLFVEKIY
jgi:hypothetical protein